MRSSSLLALLGSFTALGAGDIIVDFDPALEKRVDVNIKVEETVPHAFLKSQFSNPRPEAKKNTGIGVVDTRSILDSRGVLGVLAGSRRAAYCSDGYGYCYQFDRCCRQDTLCCEYGYCIEDEYVCCPSDPCDVGEGCCGQSHCYPLGGDCCSDESYCPPGNNCYRVAEYDEPVCCTDSACTAHVEENGSTSYASTTTRTRTYTTTRTQYYYWTVTWWYYYYYWTYSYNIEASVVTSTRSTTSSVLSVQTTDADAASSYFSDVSSTIDLPTPAEATSLESLAGRTTSFDEPSSTSSTTTRSTSTASPTRASGGGGPGPVTGDNNNAARALVSKLDGFTVGFMTFGMSVGLIAALL